MTSPFYFSFPFNSAAHQDYTQTTFYGRSKKRKRDDSSDLSNEDGPVVHTQSSATGSTADPRPYPHTSADELAEGKKFEEDDREDCDSYFPHIPFISQRVANHTLPPSNLARELASLNPPLHTAAGGDVQRTVKSQQSGLRQQHLAVLTTIMHRSLMEGNYMRAGRAWGLLLRAEVKGRPIDLRSNGLWGLGAELLLQGDIQRKMASDNHMDFTREGFEKARSYYQRLILQYPWKRWHSDTLSSLHFYPAMFALWISSVYDRHREALEELPWRLLTPSEYGIGPEDIEEESSAAKREAIRSSTFRSAQEIAERLDDILLCFPYSDSASLWRIGGMVARWMSDLCFADSKDHMATVGENNNGDIPGEDETSQGYELRLRTRLARNAIEERLEESEKYLEKSTRAFDTARNLKDGLGDGSGFPPIDGNSMPVD